VKTQNRNLLFVVIAAALLLCCCGAIVFGAAAVYFMWVDSPSSPITSGGPIIVVTQVVTPLPPPVRTPGPAMTQPERTRIPGAQPPSGTATPGAGAQATVTPFGPAPADASTEALLAQAVIPARDLRALALRLKPNLGDVPIVVNATPPSFKVGDTARFWVSNTDTDEHRQITAELRLISTHLYMWVEQGVRLDQRDLEKSAERFDRQTYPTNREFFGSEWTPGVDNDPRLTILHSRGLGKRTAGYYSSADQYSQLINPYSNEREMFYISADSNNARPGSAFYDGTLAHEFQHMIHWNNDRNEDSWVNEGMSELASLLNGFDPGGAEIAYSREPDTQLTTWADPGDGEDNSAHYGASYLFMTYFLDRFGEELTKAVVASPENGAAGFDDALARSGRPERFDDIFADWVVANYLDQPDTEPTGRFGYSAIDPPQPAMVETHRRFPVSASAQVSQYGADYIRLRGNGKLDVVFSGQATTTLVDTQPRGVHAWWSNRGDDSDATLTRAFDLRRVSTATLSFSLWYHLEDGWDYAYVMASSDGGKRWQILPGAHTTDKNPVGNAFGVGWTGVSGGGKTPQWVQEQVDLSAFADQEILLRFEYVTDDAVNKPGLMLDDISIPAIGYVDDGERGMAGWEGAGWVLTNNRLAQRWLVQLLEVGRRGIVVQRMDVGGDGKGRLSLQSDLTDLQAAVLIISALAPATTEAATYNYTIAPR